MTNARDKLHAYAVVLAGGRGTRFWPRSRTRTPKQLLNIIGAHTMLQQTTARLSPLFLPANLWIVTNEDQSAEVRKQLPRVAKSHVLAEPIGRNTAAAIGLAAIHLRHEHRDALMAVLPADHYIAQSAKYRALVQAALQNRSSTRPNRRPRNSAHAPRNRLRLHRTRQDHAALRKISSP